MYAIDRLTAPKPTWEYAVLFAKGVHPFSLTPEGVEIRYIKDEGLLILKEKGVQNPFEENNMDSNAVIDKEVHFYVDEIVRFEFFEKGRRVKLKAPVSTGEAPSGIVTAEGENLATARERESLEKGKSPLSIAKD